MASPLHWSFDHSQSRSQRGFAPELLTILRGSFERTPKPGVARYMVLPNHWGGFASSSEKTDKLAYGEAVIITKGANEGNRTDVEYSNVASGETLRLRYRTDGSPIRQLQGPWEVDARNDGPGMYKTFTCSGEIKDGSVRLTVAGLALDAGSVGHGEPVICSWTLYEIIPALVASGKTFTVIDDGEKVKRSCRLKPMGEWVCEGKRYSGYALQGIGAGHTYYWIDENGKTAVMSNPFNTFVLAGTGGTA